MSVAEFLQSPHPTAFSFEVLPPMRGRGIHQLYAHIDKLMEFGPSYINITTHRSEVVYRETPEGMYRRDYERTRPGTVAVAGISGMSATSPSAAEAVDAAGWATVVA